MKAAASHAPCKSAHYELEITIAAPPSTVWDALTAETNSWWLPDFHMVGPDSEVTLEPHAGGHLIERTADGGSLLWYTVIMATPGESLHLVGHVAPQWGGPATTMLDLALSPQGEGTKLTVRDSRFGNMDSVNGESLVAGWTQLFGDGLRDHVERSRK